MTAPADVWALMWVGHCLADYPLQGDFLSRAKNRAKPIDGVPWQQALLAHSVIHGGFVWIATGSVWLMLAEFVAHAVIDDAKCMGRLTFNQDQLLHMACKLVWLALYVGGVS